ncbi:MAG: dihydrofolate reductase family protein [Candidatus Micrarchaeota archaeon]
MVKIALFIACSLDGFIADLNGEIAWLFQDQDYGYSKFYESIDVLVMGNNTYKTTLTFDTFPHKDKECFVFSKKEKREKDENVTFVKNSVRKFILDMQKNGKKKIWLVGGSELIYEFLKENLIDEFIISIHPILLGRGINLFKESAIRKELKLIKAEKFETGLVQLTYKK